MNVNVFIVVVCVTFTLIRAENCKRDIKCKVSRIHSMKAADCWKKDMTMFPQCLPSDIEVVDLSYNRIRKIAKDDLKKYSNIKMLYLNDNLIRIIDKEAFEGKDDLHTLDLSLNGISKLPTVLFNLPSLQSLYLGQNLNMNIVDVVEKAKPITSPLFHLDISNVMSEEANELPDLGLLPSLQKYNISGNQLISITTRHFAGICSLKALDTTNVTLVYEEDPCECWKINRWLKSRKVNFLPFGCTKNDEDCPGEVPPDDLHLHKKCLEEVELNIKKAKIKTILLIIIPIIVVVVILGVSIYCFVARRKQKQKQKKNEGTEALMLNNAREVKK